MDGDAVLIRFNRIKSVWKQTGHGRQDKHSQAVEKAAWIKDQMQHSVVFVSSLKKFAMLSGTALILAT